MSATQPNQSEQIYPMRLQKFLARAGVASRRGSENLMTAGRVCVNGSVVTELGSKVDPNCDVVTVDGVEVTLGAGSVYLILNKPAGYLTTMSDPYNRPTVAELVPCDTYPGLFPVGRLDMDTTGLLLFTTNGDIAQKLLHPSFEKTKNYLALIDSKLWPAEKKVLQNGLLLDDGICSPAKVKELAKDGPEAKAMLCDANIKFFADEKTALVSLTIHEGRNHQVKRMFEAVGHEVVALHRTTFGPLALGDLGLGSWRMLTESEQKLVES